MSGVAGAGAAPSAKRSRAAGGAGAGEAPGVKGLYVRSDGEDELVPNFDTKEECLEYVEKHVHTTVTNPDDDECHHVITLLVTWKQVQTYLLAKLAEFRRAYPHEPMASGGAGAGTATAEAPDWDGKAPRAAPVGSSLACEAMDSSSNKNRFIGPEGAGLRRELQWRLDKWFHCDLKPDATLNTLRYLFFHMRCGIFVMIRKSTVVMFVPFANKDYRNTWSDELGLSKEGVREYSARKQKVYAPEDVIEDTAEWWANGNIICNVRSAHHWSDQFFAQLKEMMVDLCRERDVPDCEFFLNKRDYPHLKADLSEPYDFIYGDATAIPPLVREKYNSYAPILSFFCSSEFADLPFPPTDDWETATGKVYPPLGVDIRSAKKRQAFACSWKDKVATALFRGGATGGGVTPATNQRLRLAALSAAWRIDPLYNGEADGTGVPYLDAGVVGWNPRDKKIRGEPMTFLDKRTIGIKLAPRIPMYEQVKYKYIFYVEGHCAAARYASLMVLGSVILKVESITKADHLWYFPLLKAHDIRVEIDDITAIQADHIPVRQDLGDLADVLSWCRSHDAACEKIAANAASRAELFMGRDGLLDYMQMMLFEIGARQTGYAPAAAAAKSAPAGTHPDWWGPQNVDYGDIALPVEAPPTLGPSPSSVGATAAMSAGRAKKKAKAKASADRMRIATGASVGARRGVGRGTRRGGGRGAGRGAEFVAALKKAAVRSAKPG